MLKLGKRHSGTLAGGSWLQISSNLQALVPLASTYPNPVVYCIHLCETFQARNNTTVYPRLNEVVLRQAPVWPFGRELDQQSLHHCLRRGKWSMIMKVMAIMTIELMIMRIIPMKTYVVYHIYVYVYVYIYIYVILCMCIYVYVYLYIYIYVCRIIYVCMYVV